MVRHRTKPTQPERPRCAPTESDAPAARGGRQVMTNASDSTAADEPPAVEPVGT